MQTVRGCTCLLRVFHTVRYPAWMSTVDMDLMCLCFFTCTAYMSACIHPHLYVWVCVYVYACIHTGHQFLNFKLLVINPGLAADGCMHSPPEVSALIQACPSIS